MKMKCLLLLFFVLTNSFAFGQSFDNDDISYKIIINSLGKTGLEVISPLNVSVRYKGNIIIPATVNYNNIQYDVISIGDAAFLNSPSLESVYIPDGVLTIGNYAFLKVSSLKSVRISETTTWIGSNTFDSCSSLESIVLPSSLISFGFNLFRDCISLKSIQIPKKVKRLTFNSFWGCKSLESIVLSDNLESIESSVFRDCNSLKLIQLYAVNPPIVNNEAFVNVDKKLATLYVPSGSIDLYKKANIWKDFLNIKEIEGNSINHTESLESLISIQGRLIEIITDEPAMLKLYDINGRLIVEKFDTSIEAPMTGIYVLQVGEQSMKISIK